MSSPSTLVTIIGLGAASCTTLSFLPQLVRTWETRSTEGISAWWLASFITGLSLWLCYGLLLPSTPIIIANAATLLLTVPILAIKLGALRRRKVEVTVARDLREPAALSAKQTS